MTYKFLGKTGVRVSTLAYGTMSFGGDADEAMSGALFKACREAGVNLFDCADMYAGGRSEEILGRLVKGCREEVLITSKVYFATSPDVNGMGASRRRVQYAVEKSLRRLATDRIDIYYIHRFDDRTPLEETLRAFDDLVRQGKIVYTGASNFAAWQVAKGLGISARDGLAAFACVQPMYSLVKRQAESEILPMAASEGLGVFPYNVIGGGLLSGKYGVGRRPEAGRLVDNKIYETRYRDEANFEAADRFAAFARERGFHPAALAAAWAGAHPAVTAPILGARDTGQLATLLEAASIPMTPELRAEISALSPGPPPATDRNEERTDVNFGVR
ncbi:MAG TPA: aldo/keto reductase [Candidatus Aminicenantes bacterium]|nr:aldo/keto reductase [Candidatus Aminicenantes bacterium]